MNVNEKSSGGSSIAPDTKLTEVVKFFPVCVDNFFDDPDRIMNYAKSLSKYPDSNGRWPGKRTKPLWEIDDELNHALLLKIFSCYYDLSYQNVSWEGSELYFQEIPTFSKNKNDVKNRGWIHTDVADHEGMIGEVAGLVYLTPDSDPDTGTSFFKMKQNDKECVPYNRQFAKHLLYRENYTVDEDYYIKKVKDHEKLFVEKTRFANIYNRMIMYDTNEFHRANNYYIKDGKDSRLTLIFFVAGLKVISYPLERIKGGEWDELIECRCAPKDEYNEK